MIEELDKRAKLIKDKELQGKVLRVIYGIPENIWKAPSAFYAGHHLDDERQYWGNALHSIRVHDTCLIIASSLLVVGWQLDCLKASALLHDIGKRGPKGDTIKIMTSTHPYIVADIVKEYCNLELPKEVLQPIEDHMGKWSRQELPDFLETKKADNSMILHLADCIESRLLEVLKSDY